MNFFILLFLLAAGLYLLLCGIKGKGRIYENNAVKDGKGDLHKRIMRILCFVVSFILLFTLASYVVLIVDSLKAPGRLDKADRYAYELQIGNATPSPDPDATPKATQKAQTPDASATATAAPTDAIKDFTSGKVVKYDDMKELIAAVKEFAPDAKIVAVKMGLYGSAKEQVYVVTLDDESSVFVWPDYEKTVARINPPLTCEWSALTLSYGWYASLGGMLAMAIVNALFTDRQKRRELREAPARPVSRTQNGKDPRFDFDGDTDSTTPAPSSAKDPRFDFDDNDK